MSNCHAAAAVVSQAAVARAPRHRHLATCARVARRAPRQARPGHRHAPGNAAVDLPQVLRVHHRSRPAWQIGYWVSAETGGGRGVRGVEVAGEKTTTRGR
ncbi:hypothetical protein ABZP36_035389 [Zizania latifolia]